METEASNYFEFIQSECDTETSCTIEYSFSFSLDSCGDGLLAKYMQVFYSCLPDNETNPVGFTAVYDLEGSPQAENLPKNALVPFNKIISSIGGHYNSDIFTFICPYKGIYLFSTSVVDL